MSSACPKSTKARMWTIVTPFSAATDSRAMRLADALRSFGLDARVIGCNATSASRIMRRYQKYRTAITHIRRVHSGVIVCVNSEFTLLAKVMKLMRLANFDGLVADIYDHHAYIFKGLIGGAFHGIERLAVKVADAAIIPASVRLEQYRPSLGSHELMRIFYVSNLGVASLQARSTATDRSPPVDSEQRFTLIYAGTIDVGRGLIAIAEAASALGNDFDVRIYGGGPLLDEYLRNESFRRVYRGYFDVAALPDIYESADAICGCYELSVTNHAYCDPNKLREVFEFKKPLLTNAGTPLAARVESLGVGLVIGNVTKESVHSAVLEIAGQKDYIAERIEASSICFNRLVQENKNNLAKLIEFVDA